MLGEGVCAYAPDAARPTNFAVATEGVAASPETGHGGHGTTAVGLETPAAPHHSTPDSRETFADWLETLRDPFEKVPGSFEIGVVSFETALV